MTAPKFFRAATVSLYVAASLLMWIATLYINLVVGVLLTITLAALGAVWFTTQEKKGQTWKK